MKSALENFTPNLGVPKSIPFDEKKICNYRKSHRAKIFHSMTLPCSLTLNITHKGS